MKNEADMQARLARAWNEIMGKDQRRRIHDLWHRIQAEAELSGDDKRLADILLEHEEYHAFWAGEAADDPIAAGEGDPYLHVSLHLAIENQIVEDSPRQVHRYVLQRTAENASRHETIHEIVAVFSEYLFEALRYRRQFNRSEYTQRLHEMSHSFR